MTQNPQFTPALADIRFGYGLCPDLASATSPEDIIARLTGPDDMAAQFPIPDSMVAARMTRDLNLQRKALRKLRNTPEFDAADNDYRAAIKANNKIRRQWGQQVLWRRVRAVDGFRERLVAFWGDHFTALGKQPINRHWATPYVQGSLRPLVAARFTDMLMAATTHPVMLQYLDQSSSIGPNSRVGKRRKRGLNENLAREVLELHTLGVGGPYDQADVRQLAELFTGLNFDAEGALAFRRGWAEPEAEVVLGKRYGPEPGLEPILAALTDLARHPATAQHLARKLAVHFISDTPPEDLVADMAAAYLRHDTALVPMYETLLNHPAAWDPVLQNVKPPMDYIVSAIRALNLAPDTLRKFSGQKVQRLLAQPMRRMGQPWEQPLGPDGWPEDDRAWITPQGLSLRFKWAMNAPARMQPTLPEPERFAEQALGPFVDERVRFATRAAESQTEAIGLVLISPAFNRR